MTTETAPELYPSLTLHVLLDDQLLLAAKDDRPYSVVACVPKLLPGERQPDLALAAANVVRDLIRGDDIAGRLEDDTIIVGLPDTEADGARVLAHRLKSDLGLRTAHLRSTKWQAGVAARSDGGTAEALIAAAVGSARDSARAL